MAAQLRTLPDTSTWFRRASPRLALILGGVALVLTLAAVPLAAWAHELTFGDLLFFVIVLPFAPVGVLVARRVPGNPIGWIMLAIALSAMFAADDGFYAVRAFRLDHHGLPLARVAVFLAVSWVWMVALMPLPIALFPDGRLTSRRWRWTVYAYGILGASLIGTFLWQDASGIGAHTLKVDSSGELASFDQNPTGWVARDEHVLFPLYACFFLVWVLRHLVAWRGSTGERRQQLKWLITGGAVCIAGIAFGIVLGNSALSDVAWTLIMALPIGIGVGILKYRLYEIDKLISRTLSYLIVTGLLAGVFVGIVALATDVLPFSSPVAVAASTLSAAALFNPLRRRVQHLVDRRFNRSRYDAEAIVSAFSARLRDAVDLDTVRSELLVAVNGAVQPAHASVWVRPPQIPGRQPQQA